jgi:hypothetical protein
MTLPEDNSPVTDNPDAANNSKKIDQIEEEALKQVAIQTQNIENMYVAMDHMWTAIENKISKADAKKQTRLVAIVTLALVILMFIPMIGLGWLNRQTITTIHSCTDPKGQCYKQNAANTHLSICQLERSYAESVKSIPGATPSVDPTCP